MNSQIRDRVEGLWVSRKHEKVNVGAFTYEVVADEPLRKIKVLVKDKYLPVEFYSVDSLVDNQDKILNMTRVLKDSRLAALSQIFVGSPVHSISDAHTSLVEKQVKFETTFYPYYNKRQQLLVVVVRPTGAVFYQRLTSPDQLSYTLANQVGFLEVLKEEDGVYTSPDNLLEFKFSGDKMEIVNDLSE